LNNFSQASSPPRVEEVVDISQIWKEFETSSETWVLMMDLEPKEITVNRYIDWYRQQGIYIRKPSLQYVQTIDDMSAAHPDLLKKPFHEVLQLVAIVEYDFDNGIDRDLMAREILGEDGYVANKRRLGR